MRRALPIACLLVLLWGPMAEARVGADAVRVGSVSLTPPLAGRSSLLVEVGYPIALSGHRLSLRAFAYDSSGTTVRSWRLHPLADAGAPRPPVGARRFRFVHRIELGRSLTREAASGLRLRLEAIGSLDANGDGKPELLAGDGRTLTLTAAARPRGICSSVPQRRSKQGRRVVIAMPTCDVAKRWIISRRPAHGRARIRGGRLIYRPAKRFRGTDSLTLVGAPRRGERAPPGTRPLAAVPVVVKVGAAPKTVVRAMGDSVTAGFGYYDGGELMPLTSLLDCKPRATLLVDACSSNSKVLDDEARRVEYAPDYGLANDVSWAAQWANEYGVLNYENLAISGSEPVDWAPGGSLYATTRQIESEDPGYILMTIGANPLLSEMLFGVDNMGCAIWSDLFGKYEECIEEAFAEVHLRPNLERLYRDLVTRTSATIYLMQYQLSIPSTALAYTAFQIAEMGKLLNREIASVAAVVNPRRLQVVTPPHFNVGIDISPVYPSRYSCSRLGYKVDGPSVQIEATQDELLVSHPLSFCAGPAHGPPWVISGDTGIHPSAAGYAQMASQVPAPR